MKPVFSILALVVLVLASCRTDSRAQELDGFVSKAKHEILLADRAGFLWSTTEKLLEQGLAAKDASDLDKAAKLVKIAMMQAQLAQKQALDQAHPRMSFPKF